MTRILLVLIVASVFSNAQAQRIDPSEKDSVISIMNKLIAENYVIRDKVKLISDSIHAKDYSLANSYEAFVKQVNNDLFRYSSDKHLALQYTPSTASDLIKGVDIHIEQDKKEAMANFGFKQKQILDGNIGYLKLTFFADVTNARKTVKESISFFKYTRALIIDLRGNLGGSGSMVQLLSAYFLPGKSPELLRVLYMGGTEVTLRAETLKPSKKYLNKPIYLLCDRETFSAGEAFAYILKNRDRAVVVGETTAGAGNIAGPHAINQHVIITIPIGIIIDPITKTGWVYKGVEPDYVSARGEALDRAIELLSQSPK